MLSIVRLSRALALSLPLAAVQAADILLSSKAEPIPPTVPIGVVKEPFAKVSGRVFDINGTVGYFSGTNVWYLGRLTNKTDVDSSLAQIKETGYKVIRVHGFCDVDFIPVAKDTDKDPDRVWFQYINRTGGYINYGENGLQRLDYVVSKAEEMGIKIVLPFINYWTEGGGVSMWTEVFTGDLVEWWYEIPKIQEVYRDYVKLIVNRYKKSPAIFAWELMNEPRCPLCDKAILKKWVTSTSEYIKSLDPNHMVAMGDEGWLDPEDSPGSDGPGYDGTDGNEYVKNMLSIKTIDYATFHLYPELWGYEYDWGIGWINDHDKIGAMLNKPMVLEEYGVSRLVNHTIALGPYQDAILKSGIAGDQLWQFGPTGISFNIAYILRDPTTIYYTNSEYQRICKQHAQNMLNKKVPATIAAPEMKPPSASVGEAETPVQRSKWLGPMLGAGVQNDNRFSQGPHPRLGRVGA